ncbi:universal stress protein [Roseomonas genomospecies 6]|uniref:Universal stress protein n=1 Tax=Roseomonas genomospecies 6 TaxID=214106 RepID=A0A9W7TYI9_9PROT|nr:universal stress protein [Roseomonas genomospecies 6]KAA0679490.1 universal stress protein [Roseomonas genomospecies 6]
MPFKKILVPVLEGAAEFAAFRAALTIACRYNAHVDALHIGDEPLSTSAREAARQAYSRFMVAVAAYGVPMQERAADPSSVSASWREVTICVPEEIGFAAHDAKLVVFAADSIDLNSRLGRILQTTLLDSGRPVLIVPGGTAAPFGRKVAIAWNGDREVQHAVDGAVPLLGRADAVVVLCDPAVLGDAVKSQELQACLTRHNLAAEIVPLDQRGRQTSQVLVDKAKALGADILVIGAHPIPGRALPFPATLGVTGAVTRHVFDHVEMPTLMAS